MLRSFILAICLTIVLFINPVICGNTDLKRFWLPDNSWALEIDLFDFIIRSQDINENLDARSFTGVNSEDHILISGFMEPVKKNMNAANYRDARLKEQQGYPVVLDKIRTFEIDGIAYLEYHQLGYKKHQSDTDQLNRFAYLIKDTTVISVHLSCVQTRPEDFGIYDNIMNSICIVENYNASSFDYFIFGSDSYLNKRYKQAIDFYEKGLFLEKQTHVLTSTCWLVLVDNLGMSYGISGDHENGRRIFEYGLSVETNYPMFYYNMACYFGEKRILDSALIYLEKAYKNKENMIPGEEIPDPYEDSSFRRFWNKKEFQNKLSKIKE